MEREDLINEKNELFKKLKSESAKQAKTDLIGLTIVCLLIAVHIIYGAINHSDIMVQAFFTFLFFCGFIEIVHKLNWRGKVVKADNAQDFLTIYAKNKIITNWIDIILISIFMILFFVKELTRGSLAELLIIIIGVPLLYFITRGLSDNPKNDINRLRELTQQTT